MVFCFARLRAQPGLKTIIKVTDAYRKGLLSATEAPINFAGSGNWWPIANSATNIFIVSASSASWIRTSYVPFSRRQADRQWPLSCLSNNRVWSLFRSPCRMVCRQSVNPILALSGYKYRFTLSNLTWLFNGNQASKNAINQPEGVWITFTDPCSDKCQRTPKRPW